MASKKTLNEKNLASLGAKRLASLLMEVSQGDAAIKRRLRLELASNQSAEDVAREVRKRLATINKARSFVDWAKTKAFIQDLELQRRMIVEKVAPEYPTEAFELLWQFINLATSVFERSDDSSGYISEEFRFACSCLKDIALNANFEAQPLAERVFEATKTNSYGQFDNLISYLGPAMGDAGLEHLKKLVVDYREEPEPQEASLEDNVILLKGGRYGYSLDKDFAKRRRLQFVEVTLKEIADQQGDVDAYLALVSPQDLTNPVRAPDIAERMLAAGRADKALKILDGIDQKNNSWVPLQWYDIKAEALDALDRDDELKDFRWAAFKHGLHQSHLRSLLKSLPDFDDLEVEERAHDWALSYPSLSMALDFFVSWPALDKASSLVLARFEELHGDNYSMLSPAAEALQGRFPLAAVIVRRAMITYNLEESRTTRYKHTARHLVECQAADSYINDYANFTDHSEFEAELRRQHGKKTSFWVLTK